MSASELKQHRALCEGVSDGFNFILMCHAQRAVSTILSTISTETNFEGWHQTTSTWCQTVYLAVDRTLNIYFVSLLSDINSSEWKPAVALAAIDCAAWDGQDVCKDYNIKGFPTLRVRLRVLNKLWCILHLLFMQFIERLGTWSISPVEPLNHDSFGDTQFSPSKFLWGWG